MNKNPMLFCILMISSFYLISCAPKYYAYKSKMSYPVENNELHFENDTFSITFSLETDGIGLEMYNKSEDALRINWDEVSIAFNGVAKRIVHKETGIIHKNEVQPPTTIPPKTYLKDMLIPTEYIKTKSSLVNINSVYILPSFPRSSNVSVSKKEIMDYKGKRIVISLPFYMKGGYISKYYNIEITDVIPSKKTLKKNKSD